MRDRVDEGYVCNVSEEYRETLKQELPVAVPRKTVWVPDLRIMLSVWFVAACATWWAIGGVAYSSGRMEGYRVAKEAARSAAIDPVPKQFSGKIVGFVSTAEEAQRMIDTPGVEVVYGVSDIVLQPNQPLTIRRNDVTLSHLRIDGRDLRGKSAILFDVDNSTRGRVRSKVHPDGTFTRIYGVYTGTTGAIPETGIARSASGTLTFPNGKPSTATVGGGGQ